ncbi:MAG: hypothetical protein U1E10_11990 [Bdellovibrionales bacterium]|nr:hypothetical protein [Bdellovibrionales bacterium]
MISHRLVLCIGLVSNLVVLLYSIFVRHSNLLDFRSSALHLPAEGLNWIDSNILVAALAWIVIFFGIFLLVLLRKFFSTFDHDDTWFAHLKMVGRLSLAVGIAGLSVQLLSTEQRLVFGYFPALSMMALGIGLQTKSHFPNLLLLVSLYFSAASHKLFNFAKMQVYIPDAISARLPEELVRLEPSLVRMIPILLSYIVVPLEFSMALLLLFPKTRVLGFALAVVFHTLVSTFTNNADGLATVGLFVLIGHAGLFLLSDARTWRGRDTSMSVRESRLFFAGGALTAVLGVLAAFQLEIAGLIGLQRAMLYFSVFVVIVIYAWKEPILDPDILVSVRSWKLKVWICFLVAWALYPALIGYRNQQFGWAMMSGASSGKPVKCILLESNACVDALDLDPAAGVFVDPAGTVIASRQPVYFEKIEAYIATDCRSRVLLRGDAYREKGTIKCRASEE